MHVAEVAERTIRYCKRTVMRPGDQPFFIESRCKKEHEAKAKLYINSDHPFQNNIQP
jgi:hypothetical protein